MYCQINISAITLYLSIYCALLLRIRAGHFFIASTGFCWNYSWGTSFEAPLLITKWKRHHSLLLPWCHLLAELTLSLSVHLAFYFMSIRHCFRLLQTWLDSSGLVSIWKTPLLCGCVFSCFLFWVRFFVQFSVPQEHFLPGTSNVVALQYLQWGSHLWVACCWHSVCQKIGWMNVSSYSQFVHIETIFAAKSGTKLTPGNAETVES